MSYQTRRNLQRKRGAAQTAAQRHLRNARKAKLEEAKATIDTAIDYGQSKLNVSANNLIVEAREVLDQAERICDVICEQE